MLQPEYSPEALPSTSLPIHTSKEKLNKHPELSLTGDLTQATLTLAKTQVNADKTKSRGSLFSH